MNDNEFLYLEWNSIKQFVKFKPYILPTSCKTTAVCGLTIPDKFIEQQESQQIRKN